MANDVQGAMWIARKAAHMAITLLRQPETAPQKRGQLLAVLRANKREHTALVRRLNVA